MSRLTLVRHATLLLELGGQTLLIDPMLDDVGAQPPVEDSANDRRNPLAALPDAADSILDRADAVCITHTHIDHLDPSAIELLAGRDVTAFCQPADHERLRELGIGAPLVPVSARLAWRGVQIARTDGRHGTGEIAELLAPVSGFVLSAAADRIYVAGDTIWCDEVRDAIDEHRPTVVVVNAGEARLGEGDPITMSADDVIAVARHAAGSVVAVHMEALNHCELSRARLAAAAERAGVCGACTGGRRDDRVRLIDRSLDKLPGSMSDQAKTVRTVLGDVGRAELGHTQPHEHVLSDMSAIIQRWGLRSLSGDRPPSTNPGGMAVGTEFPASVRERLTQPVRLDNYDWIRRNVLNWDNMRLTVRGRRGRGTAALPRRRRRLDRRLHSRRNGPGPARMRPHLPCHRRPHRDGLGLLRA